MEYDYAHPELWYKDLILSPEGILSEEIRAALKDRTTWTKRYNVEILDTELCRVCGWNGRNELHSSYDPRVKIFHTRGSIGLWKIGKRWMLRDQPNDASLGNDYMTQEFIRRQPDLDVPVLKEMRLLSEPDDRIQLTLMNQVDGDRLDEVWPTLTQTQKAGYFSQLADILMRIRQFQAPSAQKVNGDPLDDTILANCRLLYPPRCKKIGATDEEWIDNIADELRHGLAKIHDTRDPDVIADKLQELRDNFPSSKPYVLTHGDLNLSNILVKDDKIKAIIDWELAGYYPWWAEKACMSTWPLESDEDFQLLTDLWHKVMPEMAEQRHKLSGFTAVMRAFNACEVDHPGDMTEWYRTGFCKCQPLAGTFRLTDIGHPPGHQIRNYDPSLAPPKKPVGVEEALERVRLDAPPEQ